MAIKGGFIFQPRYKRNGVIHRGETWLCRYRAGGRLVTVSTKARDRRKARQFLIARLAEANEGKYMLPTRETLAGFLDVYLEGQRQTVDAGTWTRYGFCKRNLLAEGSPLAGVKLGKLTVGLLSEYLTYRLNEGASKATVLKELNWLKGALAEARRQHLISTDLLLDIRDEISPRRHPGLKRAHRRRERIAYPQEVEALFNAIPKDNANLRDAVTVALYTGLRQENILELREGQISLDCEPPVIRYAPEQMKNERGHTVRLCPQAAEVVWRRHSMDPTTPERRLFHDFRPAWKRLAAKLEREGKLTDFHFHDLRRTFTSYRLAAGVDPKTVQFEVGHLDSRMTMDCYGRAVTDPEVRAWARAHFRFPWDDPALAPPPCESPTPHEVLDKST
ncbi:MAG: site-specific integrase [candidate division NC10 bacterium]|nr:site-specific integrase [candidate division NC10 bacterium]